MHFRPLRQAFRALFPLVSVLAVGALGCAGNSSTDSDDEEDTGGSSTGGTGGMGGIAVHHLHRIIPVGEAHLIHVTGRTISGRRAYEVGLCQRLAADRDGMLADADAIADEIIGCSATALTRIKRILRTCEELQVDAAKVATRSILATRERGPNDPSTATFLAARKANGD